MNKYKIVLAASDLDLDIYGSFLDPKRVLDCLKYENKILLEQDPNYHKELSKDIKNNNEKELVKYLNCLTSLYVDSLKSNEFPILIGGNHSLAISSALSSNSIQGPLGIIWFDAHTDYHSHNTTESGNLHSLPLCTINGNDINWVDVIDNKYIKEENTVIFEARSVDDGEYINLDKTKVTLITPEEIENIGMKKALDKAFNIALNSTNGVHISFDLDYLDPSYSKGVSTPVFGGCFSDDFNIIKKYFVEHLDSLKSFDIMQYNPKFDENDNTLNIILDMLNEIFKIS